MNLQHKRLFEAVVAVAGSDLTRLGLNARAKKSTKVLGWGANGVVYTMPNDLVLKVTKDESEAALGIRLEHEDDPVQGLPEVYYCAHGPMEPGELHKPRDERDLWFALVLERSVARDSLTREQTGSLRRVIEVVLGQRHETTLDSPMEQQWLDDIVAAGRYIYCPDDPDDREDILYTLGESHDVHADNVGLIRRNGALMAAIVDIGQGVELYDDGERLYTTGQCDGMEWNYEVPLAGNLLFGSQHAIRRKQA